MKPPASTPSRRTSAALSPSTLPPNALSPNALSPTTRSRSTLSSLALWLPVASLAALVLTAAAPPASRGLRAGRLARPPMPAPSVPLVAPSLRAAASTDTNGARLRALLFVRGGAPTVVVERFDRRPLPGQGPGPAKRAVLRGARVGRSDLVFAEGPVALDQLSWAGRTLRFRARVGDRRYGCHVDTTGRDAYQAFCAPRRLFAPPPPPAPPRPSRVPPRAPLPAPPGR